MTVGTGGVIYIGCHAEYGGSVIVLNAVCPNINVIARSVTTKQSASYIIFLDCFARYRGLAMTNGTFSLVIARSVATQKSF